MIVHDFEHFYEYFDFSETPFTQERHILHMRIVLPICRWETQFTLSKRMLAIYVTPN
jgi:hypothetical protein